MRKLSVFLAVLGALLISGCQQNNSTPITTPQGGTSSSINSQEEQALKSVLQNDPKNLNTLVRLGNLYMDSQRFSDAVEYYDRALAIDPKNNDVRVDAGTCYRRSGRPDIAEKYYREALALNPNHAFANMNLGVVLAYDFGKYEEATKYFEKYVKLDPASPNAAQIREEINKLHQKAAEEKAKK
jgi:cytochrome c-type biogenesis protein CcmH/NrfG